jgi:hypothetical protein
VKSYSLTVELHSKLPDSSVRGVKGIPGVRVKSAEIGKNTSREGALLAHH